MQANQAFLIHADMTVPSAISHRSRESGEVRSAALRQQRRAGRTLKKNAVLQSRYSLDPRLDKWRSKPKRLDLY